MFRVWLVAAKTFFMILQNKTGIFNVNPLSLLFDKTPLVRLYKGLTNEVLI
ncbi:hypothetical protein AGMMS49531_10040 [Endomicrobiia bacterium]|nr:hypothetical protein AGMMS49531_10040 [Endomicrobiia bacterium]